MKSPQNAVYKDLLMLLWAEPTAIYCRQEIVDNLIHRYSEKQIDDAIRWGMMRQFIACVLHRGSRDDKGYIITFDGLVFYEDGFCL